MELSEEEGRARVSAIEFTVPIELLDVRQFRITTLTNAIDNLEMMSFELRSISTPWRWKWCIIAAHQALYGFLICALEGTTFLNVIDCDVDNFPKGSESKKVGASHFLTIAEHLSPPQIADKLQATARGQKDGKYANYTVTEQQVLKWLKQQPRLIDIDEALRRMKTTEPNTSLPFRDYRNDNLPYSNSRRLVLTNEEDKAITTLIKKFRNQFEHYTPKIWYIDLDIFPPLFTHIMRVTRFIALESNCIFYPQHEEQKVRELLAELDAKLAGIAQ